MIKKMILLVVAILLMGASMTGCSVLEKGIDEYSKDKEECVLNTDNVTQFTYKGDSFTILDFLHISITDEGTGFTSEAIHHAQEQFFMGDKSRTSNMHFGMGLYITNSIIKQHDGQLILSNSKKTGGAQVIIKIPY